jgi:hypothetical protein
LLPCIDQSTLNCNSMSSMLTKHCSVSHWWLVTILISLLLMPKYCDLAATLCLLCHVHEITSRKAHMQHQILLKYGNIVTSGISCKGN